MDFFTTFIFAGLIFFAAHVVAGVTGFGTAILGLPLLAMLVGLDVGKQSLLILSSLLYIYIVIRWRREIDFKQFVIIVAFAAIGLPLGMWLYELLPRRAAMIALGVFVALVGLRNVLQLMPDTRAPRWLAKLLLVAGGIVHGAFTTGGPLLIVYADQALKEKSRFRATLSLMWLALNVILTIGWSLSQAWKPESLKLTLMGLPFMIGGLICGEWLHHSVSEQGFRQVVNLTLIAIGALLVAFPAN